jgi:4-amino-4-deoxy-L-arabinose transferase-like glycosyltransferase
MEKPPLLYWLTAMSFALFGYVEWAARVAPALSSLACVTLLCWFGRRTGHEQEGRLAALIFASGIGVLAMSRVLMFDMLLTAFLTAAQFNAWLFLKLGRRASLRWAYAALALAVLTKGLVAVVLFSMVLLGALLVVRQAGFWRSLWTMLDPVALLIFAALVLPWHVAASSVEPIFAWFYFYNEHVLRFLGKREPYDYYGGPWWYYLPRMVIYLFPWCFMLLLRFAPPAGPPAERDLRGFLLLAWLLPLVFFSASGAKANYYLVAVMPFAALHLALMVCQRDWRHSPVRMLPPTMIGIACVLLAMVAMTRSLPAGIVIRGLDANTFLVYMFGGAGLLAGALAVLAWKRAAWSLVANVLLSLWFAAAMGLVLSAMEPTLSSRALAQNLQKEHASRPVYIFHDFERKSSLAFYLAQPIRVVESVSADLYWGNRLRINDIMVSAAQFKAAASRRPLVLVVTDEYHAQFLAWDVARSMRLANSIGNVRVYVN